MLEIWKDLSATKNFNKFKHIGVRGNEWPFSHESPQSEPVNSIDMPDRFFNWTVTYKMGSDFHYPYGSYARLPSAENPPIVYALRT